MRFFQVNFLSKLISILFIVLIFFSLSFLIFLSFKPIKIQNTDLINNYLVKIEHLNVKKTGESYLRFNKSSRNFELLIEDFETEDIYIADLLLATDIKSIISGNLKPKILKLYDAKVALDLDIDFEDLNNKPSFEFSNYFSKQKIFSLFHNDLKNLFSNFKIIEINNSSLNLYNRTNNKYLNLDAVDLRIEISEKIKEISFSIHQENNSILQISLERSGKNIFTNGNISKFDLTNILNFSYKKNPFKKFSTSGDFNGKIDELSEFFDLKVNLVTKIETHSTKLTNYKEIELNDFIFDISLNSSSGLNIKSSLNFDDSIVLINYTNNSNSPNLLINCDKITFEDLISFWPDYFNKSAKNWIDANITGEISELILNFNFENQYDKLSDFSGSMKFKNVMLSYIDGMPRVIDLEGYLQISNKEIFINFESGNSRNLILRTGSVKLYDLDQPFELAIVKLNIDSTTGYIKEYLDLSPIDKNNYEKLKKINGDINIDLMLKFPLLLDLNTDEIEFDSKIKVLNAAYENFIENYDMKGFDLVAQINNEKISYEGKGIFNNLVINFIGSELFEGLNEQILIESKFSGEQINSVSNKYINELSGEFLLKANCKFDKADNSSQISGSVDFKNLLFKDIFLGDNAKSSEDGLVNFDFTLSDFDINSFSLNVLSNSLQIDIKRKKKNNQYKTEIKTFFSPIQNFKGMISQFENTTKINLTGEKLNISKFLKSKNFSRDIDFEVDVISLTLDKEEIKKPTVKGSIRNKMYEYLVFKQNYTNENGNKITHRIEIEDEFGKKRLLVFSNNFAEMFSYFRNVESLKNGMLYIEAKKNTKNQYSGNIVVKDFVSYDIPFFAKLFSFFSLKGLEQKIKDGGIFFEKLSSSFVFEDNNIFFKNALAKGSDLGLTFEGEINITDDTYDIDGTYIPAYTLNTLFTELPIVGDLITAGSPEEGLIAATFSIKNNNLGETSFGFNPISVIVPNIIKNFLDFSKKEETIDVE